MCVSFFCGGITNAKSTLTVPRVLPSSRTGLIQVDIWPTLLIHYEEWWRKLAFAELHVGLRVVCPILSNFKQNWTMWTKPYLEGQQERQQLMGSLMGTLLLYSSLYRVNRATPVSAPSAAAIWYHKLWTNCVSISFVIAITRRTDHATPLYPQKLALTSPTSGGRSVGIVRSRTKATELV
jgi:hypothetical protein